MSPELVSIHQSGSLVVGGVTFEPLRLPVPQIAAGLPTEIHVFSRGMMEAAVAAERERCAKLADEYATWGGSNFAAWFNKLAAAIRT